MAYIYYPPTQNGLQKTLDAQLDQATTASLTLNNVTGIQNKPGVVVINRVDASGTEKDAADREFITYTAVSGSTLTGLARGLAGSSDQDHATGSVVEFIPDITWGQGLIDFLNINHVEASGLHDFNGTKVIIDADADTSMTADTDDQIDWELGGSDRFRMKTSDFDIVTATGNITVGAADPNRTISLPAGSWSPTTTSGCADIATTEAGTNDIDYKTLDFDASSDEYAFTSFQMPDSWDAGVVQFQVTWTNAGGGAAETVDWVLSGRAYADDDAIDAATGTGVTVSDTWIAQGDIHQSGWSGDVTLAGTPAAGEWVHLKIMRDVSEDDLTGDAKLINVRIRYKQSQYSD